MSRGWRDDNPASPLPSPLLPNHGIQAAEHTKYSGRQHAKKEVESHACFIYCVLLSISRTASLPPTCPTCPPPSKTKSAQLRAMSLQSSYVTQLTIIVTSRVSTPCIVSCQAEGYLASFLLEDFRFHRPTFSFSPFTLDVFVWTGAPQLQLLHLLSPASTTTVFKRAKVRLASPRCENAARHVKEAGPLPFPSNLPLPPTRPASFHIAQALARHESRSGKSTRTKHARL